MPCLKHYGHSTNPREDTLELLKGRKPNVSYYRVFGCKCFILNNWNDNLGKLDAKFDEWIFIGYSSLSKTYRVYNNRNSSVEESIHVAFDESSPQNMGKGILYDVSGLIMGNLIDDNIPKEDSPPKTNKEDTSKQKEETEQEGDK